MSEPNFRKVNARTQPIYLVHLDKTSEGLIFHIVGTRMIVYKIKFIPGKSPSCSCPDHCTRKVTCKHIYFVLEKVLRKSNTDWLKQAKDVDGLYKIVVQRLPHLASAHVVAGRSVTDAYKKILTKRERANDLVEKEAIDELSTMRNDECAICLCEFPEDIHKNDVVVCDTCKNGSHSDCWEKWKSQKGGALCIYCRTEIATAHKSQKVFGNNVFIAV